MTYTATSEDTAQSATRRLPELPQVGEDYPSAYPDLVPTNAEDMEAEDIFLARCVEAELDLIPTNAEDMEAAALIDERIEAERAQAEGMRP